MAHAQVTLKARCRNGPTSRKTAVGLFGKRNFISSPEARGKLIFTMLYKSLRPHANALEGASFTPP